ncbi:hypothetical protein WMY93_033678 [Mugilogobius chulae]|uniref:Uncharacterized protein n=1 Tax=Mugilogobius chulae TaxID=88201 RepID=A0AAW0MJG7_9GOBI
MKQDSRSRWRGEENTQTHPEHETEQQEQMRGEENTQTGLEHETGAAGADGEEVDWGGAELHVVRSRVSLCAAGLSP